eukprot:7368830-Prymnesium_polylepis.1
MERSCAASSVRSRMQWNDSSKRGDGLSSEMRVRMCRAPSVSTMYTLSRPCTRACASSRMRTSAQLTTLTVSTSRLLQ